MDSEVNQVLEMVSKNIQNLRKERDYTQYKLAKLLGVSVSRLSQLETANRMPSLAFLIRISKGLDVPLSELFKDSENFRLDRVKSMLMLAEKLPDEDIKMIEKFLSEYVNLHSKTIPENVKAIPKLKKEKR